MGECDADLFADSDVQAGLIVDLAMRTKTVVFLDEDSGASLEFSADDDVPTEDDYRSGAVGYCVVVNGGPVVYGGVEQVMVAAGGITVAFESDAAEVLGIGRHVEIPVRPDGQARVRPSLWNILANTANGPGPKAPGFGRA